LGSENFIKNGTEGSSEQWWNCIPNLGCYICFAARELEVIIKRLKARSFSRRDGAMVNRMNAFTGCGRCKLYRYRGRRFIKL